MHPNYIYYYILQNINSLKQLTGGIGIPWLNKTNMGKFKIIAPSTKIQEKYVEIYKKKETRLNQYDQEIKSIEYKLQELQDLGKRVIEYHITIDEQPMIEISDGT